MSRRDDLIAREAAKKGWKGEIKERDWSHFERLGKKESVRRLAEHEQAGTLLAYMTEVAPDYVEDGEVLKFCLCNDADLWNSAS